MRKMGKIKILTKIQKFLNYTLKMLPLSFAEYYELVGGDKRTAFQMYYRKGGFPYAATIDEKDIYRDYLQGIYNTVLL